MLLKFKPLINNKINKINTIKYIINKNIIIIIKIK